MTTPVDLYDPANAWQARALRAEAALDDLEAQVLANETPHRTRMRLAEHEVVRLRAALTNISVLISAADARQWALDALKGGAS